MDFPQSYKCLSVQSYHVGNYQIVPIRYEDRMLIRQWRNEQVYHLRQQGLLAKQDQEAYFQKVVKPLFSKKQPNQLLFSYLENGVCIGYGGLVHMNWTDKHAEISFLMDTQLEADAFVFHWKNYLSMIEELAFDELNFHKIFTYAFNLRPKLYEALSAAKFNQEARLKDHCLIDDKFIDVLIHSKFNPQLSYRLFNKEDKAFIYELNNEKESRLNSFYPKSIALKEHETWFNSRLSDKNTTIYMCESANKLVGIVRFQKDSDICTVGINLIKEYRSKGLAKKILKDACSLYFKNNEVSILAYIKPENIASIVSFKKAGFIFKELSKINGFDAVIYKLENNV